jgi:flagellar basal-body rod protein FlgB
MAIDNLFGTTINLLAKNVDLRSKNHGHIAGNIANAETPHYRAKTFSFETQLQDAVKDGKGRAVSSVPVHPRHIPLKGSANTIEDVQGAIEETVPPGMGKDGNGVDLEREMGRMAENQILYNASIQILAKKFEGLKNAVKGGN